MTARANQAGEASAHAPESAAQLAILRHALGLRDDGSGRMCRNSFVTDRGGDDYAHCLALVAAGIMTEHPGGPLSGGSPVFTVTELGRNVARSAGLLRSAWIGKP